MALTSDQLIKELSVLDENVLAEAARQPALFIDAARYRVSKMRKRAQANAALEARWSHLALRIRAQKNEEGERRLTEAALKASVESRRSVKELRAGLERAYEEEEFSKLILEAYRMRRDAIRIIAEAQNIEGIRGTKELEHIEQRNRLRKEAECLDRRRTRTSLEPE